MQFIDLQRQYARIEPQVRRRIDAVLAHGRFIMGPEVGELESELALRAGVDHAVGCASGTDALLLALMALEVRPGDRIVTTPFTFVATAEVIALLGAVPVFVDVDPDDFNLCPDALAAYLGSVVGTDRAPVGVIAVDLFGQAARYDRIEPLCADAGIWLVEDAAQAFGARQGERRCGGFGTIATTSFFPAKPLGGFGDGGAVFTGAAELDARLRSIRVHGQGENKYDNVRIGINGRLDTLQAAILLAKLEIFDDEVRARQRVASGYAERFAALGFEALHVPRARAGNSSVWAQYTLRLGDRRERVRAACADAGVPTAVYYDKPLHRQDGYRLLSECAGPLPVADRLCAEVLSLPMHPYLSESEQQRVVAAVATGLAV